MKKKIITALASVGSVAAFAEGTTQQMDTTAAANMVQSATTGLQSLLETVTPYLVTLLLAGLAVWAGIMLVKLVKRVFGRSS